MPYQLPPGQEVYGSTLKDSIHIGPNQAGNKGMLAYRADTGIPGYTGFCPASSSISPARGSNVHTGRIVDEATRDMATLSTVGQPSGIKGRVSEQFDQFTLRKDQTKPTDKTGGGYWFSQRQEVQDAPLLGSTVYRQEVLKAGETAASQLASSNNVRNTLVGYAAARQRAGSAPSERYSYHQQERAAGDTLATARFSTLPAHLQSALTMTGRPATAVAANGTVVGYETTYSTMVVQNPLIGGAAAAGGPASPVCSRSSSMPASKQGGWDRSSTGTLERYKVMPRVMEPGMQGTQTSYGVEYGSDGADPYERAAPNESFQTRLAVTRDLAHGTTRNTHTIPGYTGHLPASKYNVLGKGQVDTAQGKLNQKKEMTLYNLDQFSRGRVPHYTGYKPQDPTNITSFQPSQGPTAATTSGAAHLASTRGGVPPQDHKHHINSRDGLMSFFTSPGESVSDNGLSNAQMYYHDLKPGEGRMAMWQLSKATEYGAPFNGRNSLV